MASKYFKPIPPGLPEKEHAFRQQRINQAEWGVAVACLGGAAPASHVLNNLQCYIDGELTLEEVSELTHQAAACSPAYQAMLTRAHLTDM